MNSNIEIPLALVGYHNHCIDGFTSAWIAQRKLEEQEYNVEMIALDYTSESIEGLFHMISQLEKDYNQKVEHLYIVDFSVTMPTINQFKLCYPNMRVMVLDHHKTAFEEYARYMEVEKESTLNKCFYNTTVMLDNNESGASLCWRYFYPNLPMPKLVAYVKDHDLWRFELGDETKWINKYIMSQEKTFVRWDDLHLDLDDPVIEAVILKVGSDIQEEHDDLVAEVAGRAVGITLAGCDGFCVCCPPELMSDVGHELAKASGSFGAMYHIDLGDNSVKWSLRSLNTGDFDVEVIAKKYGGGGHKNAAGFIRKLLEEVGVTHG